MVAVENRRRLKFGRVQPTPRPWKRSEERYLGIRMDPEVARLIGRHPAVVAEHRRQLGIPAVRRRRFSTATTERPSRLANARPEVRRQDFRALASRRSASFDQKYARPAF